MPAPEEEQWLTVQEASRRLGVHPATLRQWADRGKIHAFRTPGGHRRFAAADVQALISAEERPAGGSEVEMWVQTALGRARMEMTAGRFDGEPWYRQASDAARARYRKLGRELLRLLADYLSAASRASPALEEAGRLGWESGVQAGRDGMSAAAMVQAFLAFREYLVQTMLQVPLSLHEGLAGGVPQWHQRITAFTGRVLLGALEGWGSVQSSGAQPEPNETGRVA